MHECKITLGKTIKNARQEHGFSQKDLCNANYAVRQFSDGRSLPAGKDRK
jgi:transcriptional regulator with XRE-family HTH domain